MGDFIRKILLVINVVLVLGCWMTPNDTLDDNTDENFDSTQKYSKDLWGEWIRMDTGETWYIKSDVIKKITEDGREYINPITGVTLNRQSDKVVMVKEGGNEYYIYASRITNGAFIGTIVGEDNNRSVARAMSGLGGAQITISNLKNSANNSTKTTDSDGNFMATGIVPGDEYSILVNGQETMVTPSANEDNIGTVTVTNGVNFKTRIRTLPYSNTDLMRLYANSGTYNLKIEIENTGNADCLAATYQLSFDDDLIVSSAPLNNILGTIEPGQKKSIEISIGCKIIQNEYEFKKIGIQITDQINNKTWNDSVSLRFNKAIVTFNIKSDNEIQGVCIIPNGKAYHFQTERLANSYYTASLNMPWSTKDYLIVFSGATADKEAVYSLGVNTIPDTNFTRFNELGNYESNNTENTATQIGMQSKIMSYLHKNDIDYYKINLGFSAPSYNPVSIADFVYSDETISGDGIIIPSSQGQMRILLRNNTNISKSFSVDLSTYSTDVMIENSYLHSSSIMVDNLEPHYYLNLNGNKAPITHYNDNPISEIQGWSFVFYVSSSCPIGSNIPFTVTFNDSSGGSWEENYIIPVQ
jgi:hypothetical protein